jgi:uncharacterized damage-inducible protein DinB
MQTRRNCDARSSPGWPKQAAILFDMQTADVVRLFDYLYWIRDRILAAAAHLPDEEFRSTETVATRDLRSTLVHELDVESSWRLRLAGVAPEAEEPELHAPDYPTIAALAEDWRRDESAMRAWIGSLSDAQLAASPAHERASLPLVDYLLHVVGHGIEEFTEAALLLTRAGHSPGDIEFLEYVDPR